MPLVRIKPLGREIQCLKGEKLIDVFHREGIFYDFPCGGKGLCGKCRIKAVPAQSPSPGTEKVLSPEEIKSGICLACTFQVEDDVTITLLSTEKRISTADKSIGNQDEKFYKEPILVFEKYARADDVFDLFSGEYSDIRVLNVLEQLSLERKKKKPVSVVTEKEVPLFYGSIPEDRGCYGIAVDIGTTTVDVALVDCVTLRIVGEKTFLNRQTAFGADVFSRADSFHKDRKPVREAVLTTIREGVSLLMKEAGVTPSEVFRTVVVGNSIMIHIFLDVDPFPITLSPYLPVFRSMIKTEPGYSGWDFQKFGYVYTLPLISAFVGSDTAGVMVSENLGKEDRTILLVDIGTNGEIVLNRNDEIITTSAAAGPAFEGAQIECGMRALPGAVTGIRFNENTGLQLQTQGGVSPRGICGSGILSSVCFLLRHGIINKRGKFKSSEEISFPELRRRCTAPPEGRRFNLTEDGKVYISQKDIREVQLAKGAISSAVKVLLDRQGISLEQIDELRLAGNFGNSIDIEEVFTVGLLPRMSYDKVVYIGNAALNGAVQVLLYRDAEEAAEKLTQKARNIELSREKDFQKIFAKEMLFPVFK